MPNGRCLEEGERPSDSCLVAPRTASGGRARGGVAMLAGWPHAPTRVLSGAARGVRTGFRGDIVAPDARARASRTALRRLHSGMVACDTWSMFAGGSGTAAVAGSPRAPIRCRARGI